MKCVRSKATSKITRVADDKAALLVNAGTHNYTNKAVWKAGGRKV